MPFLLLLAIIEIILFVVVGELIGFIPTILILVAFSAIGVIMLRTTNVRMMQKLQKKMEKGEMPLKEMMNAPFQMIAGMLFTIPGFLTSILAILCLIPGTRNALIGYMMRSGMMKRMNKNGMGNMNMKNFNFDNMQKKMNTDMHKKHSKPANEDPHTLEGEFWEEDKPKKPEDQDEKKD